uniref:IP20666p n=1 Tax=Drosophila melanogaster TaxID=7227 RepID=B7FNM3_DROME|nr:IP20666p [Drosophila melanogaster]
MYLCSGNIPPFWTTCEQFSSQSDSPQRSITLSQIRAAYSQRTGQDFPVKGGTRTQMCFVLTIPYVACFTSQIGTLRFFTIELNQE